jgi:hypothetical protein
MKNFRLTLLQACGAVWLATLFSFNANAAPRLEQSPASAVVFFDVSDLPARIDEPRLSKSDREFVLDCVVANRSGEQLLGIRLILLVIDPAGKLRSRMAWTERSELAMYSIKTFAFHPPITGEPRKSDQLFLAIDEVIGRETIWRAAGAEKALRAYSRGQHDVVPTVRTFANKYDPRPGMLVMPLIVVPPLRKE